MPLQCVEELRCCGIVRVNAGSRHNENGPSWYISQSHIRPPRKTLTLHLARKPRVLWRSSTRPRIRGLSNCAASLTKKIGVEHLEEYRKKDQGAHPTRSKGRRFFPPFARERKKRREAFRVLSRTLLTCLRSPIFKQTLKFSLQLQNFQT